MESRSFGLAAIALAIGIGGGGPATHPVAAQAQQTRQITVVQEMAPVGFAPGQMLRYTWTNLATPESQEQFEPLRVVVRLLGNDATVLAQEAAEAVGAGRFQTFDFSRSAITTAAGPLQVRVEASVVGRSAIPDTELKPGRASFSDEVEIIDELTGATVVVPGKGGGMNELTMDDTAGKEKAGSDGFQIISAGRDRMVGLVPGQSLRITATNPIPGEGSQFKPLFAFTVLNAEGAPVVEGAEVALEPGAAHSVEIPYSALSGTASGGRVQVRTEVRRHFHGITNRISQGGRDLAPVVLEIVDAGGRTTVHLSQKPKEIVVVGSKIDR